MFCPKCGTHNLEGARFCRACGVDISLVPQALAKTLTEARHGALEPILDSDFLSDKDKDRSGKAPKRKEKDAPTLEKGLENIFVGIAFLIIFLAGLFFFRRGFMIWIWFIIPALACAGEGIGQIIRERRELQALRSPPFKPAAGAIPPITRMNGLPPRDTSEIMSPPPSITEETTKHLELERPNTLTRPPNN